MGKREEIIEILRQINLSAIENNGPTSIFIAGGNEKKINITGLSVGKDIITVTTGKYLFKRKYRIKRNEL